MKFIITLIAFFLLISNNSDNIVIKPGCKPEIFTSDNFDNLYVYCNNTLKKYNFSGKLDAYYSTISNGSLQSVDASDPMQILLFYKDWNTVIILDNKLNPVGEPILLNNLGFQNIDAVCKSKENGIWLLNIYDQRLSLYSFTLKKMVVDISLLRYTKPLQNIDYMVESSSEIYLHAHDKAIWMFDIQNHKLRLINEYPEMGFQIKNSNIYFSQQNVVYRYNTETEIKDTVHIEGINSFEKIRIGTDKVFVLNADSISIL